VSQTANDIDRIVITDHPLENEETKIADLTAGAEVPPSPHAISSALSYLRIIFCRAVNLGSWSSPHITLSETGEIAFEWWHGNKKITLYFGDGQPEFIKVWGTNIETEMDSDLLTDGWTLTSLWLWLRAA
jgi:hypothetical protein